MVKKIIDKPIKKQGITSHRVYGDWICGGASNAGCGILSKFFSDLEIKELSRQINPSKNTSLNLLPLNSKGERFPVNNSNLEPILGPRPVSDSLYLHALFEGLAKIELKGWEKLGELTGSLPKKIITIGGGSKNPQWRKIRQKIINIPIVSCKKNHFIWYCPISNEFKVIIFGTFDKDLKFLMKRVSQTTHLNLEYIG